MWGAILRLLSGIVDLIPKARKWGMDSKIAKKADADKARIDSAIDAPRVRVPDPANGSDRKR